MKKYKYTKYITYNGKRYVVRADSERELIIKEHEKRLALENNEPIISSSMTVNKWVDEWLHTYKETTVSPESLEGYLSTIRCHIIPHIGHMQLKNVRALHIQQIISNMAGMSKKMINKVSNLLFQIFSAAKRNGLISNNPAEDIVKPKGTEKSRRALYPEERDIAVKVASHHRAGPWIMLMLYAGLRPAEAAAITWGDVDFDLDAINIHQNVKRKGGHIGSPKTEAGIRRIPLAGVLKDYLLAYRNTSSFPTGEEDFICLNSRGSQLKSTSMQRLWDYFKNEMNIAMGCAVNSKGRALPPYRVADDLVPYCFRHTYCTDLQDAGIEINVAREYMGHSDISVTSKIYTHSSDITFKSSLKKINDLQGR